MTTLSALFLAAFLGVGDRRFALTVTPDAAPEVSLAALATRRADGRLAQGFSARDDNGVAAGTARIVADLLTGARPPIDLAPFSPARFGKWT